MAGVIPAIGRGGRGHIQGLFVCVACSVHMHLGMRGVGKLKLSLFRATTLPSSWDGVRVSFCTQLLERAKGQGSEIDHQPLPKPTALNANPDKVDRPIYMHLIEYMENTVLVRVRLGLRM